MDQEKVLERDLQKRAESDAAKAQRDQEAWQNWHERLAEDKRNPGSDGITGIPGL